MADFYNGPNNTDKSFSSMGHLRLFHVTETPEKRLRESMLSTGRTFPTQYTIRRRDGHGRLVVELLRDNELRVRGELMEFSRVGLYDADNRLVTHVPLKRGPRLLGNASTPLIIEAGPFAVLPGTEDDEPQHTTIAQETVDPSSAAGELIKLVAGETGIPQRILMGSERSEPASPKYRPLIDDFEDGDLGELRTFVDPHREIDHMKNPRFANGSSITLPDEAGEERDRCRS